MYFLKTYSFLALKKVLIIVNILQSQSQSDILIMKLVIVNIGLAMLFFLIVFYINRHSIRSALKVFYSTINKLEGFQLNKPTRLS